MEEKERDGLESGNGRLLGIIDRNPGERERGSLSDGSTNLSFVTKTNERIRSAGEGNKEKRLLPLSLFCGKLPNSRPISYNFIPNHTEHTHTDTIACDAPRQNQQVPSSLMAPPFDFFFFFFLVSAVTLGQSIKSVCTGGRIRGYCNMHRELEYICVYGWEESFDCVE